MNLDVVTTHNFDAFLAKKYFIICVPTAYGRWFPRLITCPDDQFFNPDHIEGCLGPNGLAIPLPPPPPPAESLLPLPSLLIPTTLPPPVFGNPSPLITHIGTPIPPGLGTGFAVNIAKRSSKISEKQLAIELSEDISDYNSEAADDINNMKLSSDVGNNQTDIVWPS